MLKQKFESQNPYTVYAYICIKYTLKNSYIIIKFLNQVSINLYIYTRYIRYMYMTRGVC